MLTGRILSANDDGRTATSGCNTHTISGCLALHSAAVHHLPVFVFHGVLLLLLYIFFFLIYSAASCRVKIGEFLHQKHSLKGALLQSPACAVLYKCAKGCVRRGLQQHKLRNSMWRPLQETAKKICFISLICSQCQKKTKTTRQKAETNTRYAQELTNHVPSRIRKWISLFGVGDDLA